MIEILFSLSRVSIAAFGNRLWGYANAYKLVGVLFTTLAFIAKFPEKLIWAFLFFPVVYFCRCFGTRPLNNLPITKDWWAAIGRAYIWAIIPVFITAVTHNELHLLLAMGSASIAVFYWFAGKFKSQNVPIGEILTGIYIGLNFI